ncbi:hypothetical protein BDQ12DRAFT_113300 [Crucibulum laeve]|uniref:Uncharacterized protein n=1 Tax=Crucibulum laeve TaxID=68775 RepID=A0A5C3M179_9AGAR|nr:hypothetical protein BDQ12DRAFT_113300 [Crucibulum laeve]
MPETIIIRPIEVKPPKEISTASGTKKVQFVYYTVHNLPGMTFKSHWFKYFPKNSTLGYGGSEIYLGPNGITATLGAVGATTIQAASAIDTEVTLIAVLAILPEPARHHPDGTLVSMCIAPREPYIRFTAESAEGNPQGILNIAIDFDMPTIGPVDFPVVTLDSILQRHLPTFPRPTSLSFSFNSSPPSNGPFSAGPYPALGSLNLNNPFPVTTSPTVSVQQVPTAPINHVPIQPIPAQPAGPIAHPPQTHNLPRRNRTRHPKYPDIPRGLRRYLYPFGNAPRTNPSPDEVYIELKKRLNANGRTWQDRKAAQFFLFACWADFILFAVTKINVLFQLVLPVMFFVFPMVVCIWVAVIMAIITVFLGVPFSRTDKARIYFREAGILEGEDLLGPLLGPDMLKLPKMWQSK